MTRWLVTGGCGFIGSNFLRLALRECPQVLGLLGKPLSLIRYVPDRPGHDFRYALDSRRARRELGWSPQIRLTQGLTDTVGWYRTHAEWLAGCL